MIEEHNSEEMTMTNDDSNENGHINDMYMNTPAMWKVCEEMKIFHTLPIRCISRAVCRKKNVPQRHPYICYEEINL